MPTKYGVEVLSNSINVVNLHPELRARVRLAQKDERLSGPLATRLASGARTKAHQQRLFDKYNAGQGNLAADPDRVTSSGLVGSSHMVQNPGGYKHGNLSNNVGWAYAVDIGFWKGSPSLEEQKLLRDVLRDYSLYAPIVHLGEWWHFNPTRSAALISLVGRGSRGEKVIKLQHRLGLLEDGLYGPVTERAVIDTQKKLKVPVTGDWTVSDEQALNEYEKKEQLPVPAPVPTPPETNPVNIFPLTIEDDLWVVTLNLKK